MLSLIPWKKKNDGGNVAVWRDRPEYHPLAQLRNDFDSLFDRFWSDWGAVAPWSDGWRMSFRDDVEDNANEYVFRAELPGFDQDEIDVNVSGATMTVRAEHKEKNGDSSSQSFRYGSYQRTFSLPHGIDETNIDARYRNGVLEVRMPKTEQARGKRIPVSAE